MMYINLIYDTRCYFNVRSKADINIMFRYFCVRRINAKLCKKYTCNLIRHSAAYFGGENALLRFVDLSVGIQHNSVKLWFEFRARVH